jgi:hypothetical protein
MKFFKSDKEKAKSDFNKAEERFEALRFEKAGNYYFSAGETFYDIQNLKSAETSFLNAAKSYIEDELYEKALKSLREACNTSIALDKFENTNEIVQKALGYVKKIKSNKKKNKYFIIFGALSYFCRFIQGEPEEGLKLIKKIKRGIEKEFFKGHRIIHLITNFTVALRDKRQIYIERIKEDLKDLDLKQNELELVRKVLLLAALQTVITPKITFNQSEYTTNDLIQVNIKVKANSIKNLIEDPFYKIEIKDLKIDKVDVGHSDNLTLKEKPKFPLGFSLKNDLSIDFVLKPHFLKDETIIGPITLSGVLNKNYCFYIENRNEFPVKLLAPPTHLDMSVDNLKPPLIDTTFPLEVLIENNSESEARELEINITLPENLKLMRGTLQKQIYSLRPNETINWQISAKPNEAGESEIMAELKYKDPDQKIIEEKKNFSISIKL